MTIFRHESFCGSCEQDECPEVPGCARREDSRYLLHCEHCPASYHYGCAGYYDSQDGPRRGDRWVCWRCAHDAMGGFKWNWIVPSVAASPGPVVYVSSEESGGTHFHPASVLSSHATYMVVQFQTSPGQEPQTENIAWESMRVWHGSLSPHVWEEVLAENPSTTTFIPKSRKYCPPSFKKIAEQHGVPIPAHLAEPTPLVAARSAAAPAHQQTRQSGTDAGPGGAASSSYSTRRGTRGAQSSAIDPPSAEDASSLQGKGRKWLDAVREFGETVNDKVLIHMPEFMALRRDLYVHSYAVWLVVMTWGGEEVVCENKLWSALAGVFEAPQTMTNRAQKMKQVWTQFRLARVIQGDAQSFSAALEVPPIDGDLLFSKSHPVMRRWPGCKRTELPQEGAVGRASNRGTSMAAGTSVGTSARRNGTAAGRAAPRGRGRGRGGVRGRKRLRSASDSDHDRSIEAESSHEQEEEPEALDSEPSREAISPKGDTPRAPKKWRTSHASSRGGKQSMRGRSHTDSGQTELSDDEDHAGGGSRGGQRAESPQQCSEDADDPEDGAAGAMLVAEGASRLRRMPMSALPPKLPPGLDLPEGAISSEFARRLRLGDYMIRLDSSCIHTSLQAREHALEFARIALRGESPKIQFVSTEKDFLGGWWDATLRGARTGSVLEGGARFLVEENYPGDPDDPYPQTWVPLVYYGPQPYPFQTPQVMLRQTPDWKPAASKKDAVKLQLGDLVEAVDVPEEQEDTVFWRGCVHELKPDDEVVVKLLVAPYGNAGVSTDPEEQESNYQTHPPERVRRAPVDDLMGMVREPSDDPEKGEIRAVATTDQMELQVLQHTKLIVGRYAGGKGVVAMEAHATFKTAQAAHPDDPELAKVIKSRKPSKAGTGKRSLSNAISAAYQARKGGKPPPRCAAKRPPPVAASDGAQNGAQHWARSAAGHCDMQQAQVSGGMEGSAYDMVDAHMPGAARSPMNSLHSQSSGGTDGWQRTGPAEMQLGMQQMARQHSADEGWYPEGAAHGPYRSGAHALGHSSMQAASPRNTGSFHGAPVYSDSLPCFRGGMPAQPAGLYAEGGPDWELNALAQMTASHGAGVRYGGIPSPQQLVNGGNMQRYVNAHGIGGESLPQWGEQQNPGQHTQRMMPGQGMFPRARGPHG